MSDVGLGIVSMLVLGFLLVLAHFGGRVAMENRIIGDCVAMQTFRAGDVVYDCKKRTA